MIGSDFRAVSEGTVSYPEKSSCVPTEDEFFILIGKRERLEDFDLFAGIRPRRIGSEKDVIDSQSLYDIEKRLVRIIRLPHRCVNVDLVMAGVILGYFVPLPATAEVSSDDHSAPKLLCDVGKLLRAAP